ncbi:MAG: tRNA lysidine(34) synthetase TilS [Luteolibacter sp.]
MNDRQKSCVLLAENIPWFAAASRRKRWLVGVSGGADSVALLHLLVGAGFKDVVVCHLDHGLRGRASTEDAKFVGRLAKNLGLEFETARIDVTAQMNSDGESMETAARNARHEFFGNCAKKHRCSRILLAHHADDQAETVLWNLLRGSHGLRGMKAEQTLTTKSGVALQLIRPLLGVRREQLTEWLVANGHRWREDASNAMPVAVRNRLRNEVLPLLAEISNRDAAFSLIRGAAETEELDQLESWALDQVKVLDPQGRLHLPVLRSLPIALQRAALRKFLQGHGIPSPSRDLLDRGLGLLDTGGPAVLNLPGGKWLKRREGRLFFGS